MRNISVKCFRSYVSTELLEAQVRHQSQKLHAILALESPSVSIYCCYVLILHPHPHILRKLEVRYSITSRILIN